MNFQNEIKLAKQKSDECKFRECELLLERLVENPEFANASSEDRALGLLEFGRILIKLARFDKAREIIQEAKSLYLELEGRDSYGFTESMVQEGLLAYELYDFGTAEGLMAEVIEIRKQMFAPPHENLSDAINHLGEIKSRHGNDAEALVLFQEAMEMRRQALGEENTTFAESICNIGLTYMKQGNNAEAEKYMRRSLEIRERVLDPMHLDLGYSFANLGFLLDRLRKDGAEKMKKRSIEIFESALGEHPSTAVMINNLGGYYLDRGNLNEAAKCFERGLEIKEKTLGKDNPALANNLGNLAIVYARLNRVKDSAEMRARSESLFKQARANDNSEVNIDSAIVLASQLRSSGVKSKIEEAKNILSSTLDAAKKQYGAKSLKTAQVLSYILSIGMDEDLNQSKEHLIELMKIQKLHLGKHHEELRSTLENLALVLQMENNQEAAEILRLQARIIHFKSGKEDPHIALLKVRLNQAIDKSGEKSPQVLHTLKSIATFHSSKGNSEEAKEYSGKFLSLKKEIEGETMGLAEEYFSTAISQLPLSPTISFDSGSFKTCDEEDKEDISHGLELLERAISIAEKLDDKEDLPSWYSTKSRFLSLLGKATEAEECSKENIAYVESLYGHRSWQLKGPLNVLSKLLEASGKLDESKAIEERIRDLTPPTIDENEASTAKTAERLSKTMQNMMQGLMDMIGNQNQTGQEQLDPSAALDPSASFDLTATLDLLANLNIPAVLEQSAEGNREHKDETN